MIVTSATIDPERFAEHFDDAPIVEVSGRTYPVEVRYREPDEDTDQTDAIGDAVDELLRETPGDILVFLSAASARSATPRTRSRGASTGVEILPLFARQSTAAQQRVWKPHTGRRVVLATNVAETSLTVPGIRYVVDPGHGADQPLQRAAEGPAAADRADLARPPPTSARAAAAAWPTASRSGCSPRRTSRSARASPTPRSCARASPR